MVNHPARSHHGASHHFMVHFDFTPSCTRDPVANSAAPTPPPRRPGQHGAFCPPLPRLMRGQGFSWPRTHGSSPGASLRRICPMTHRRAPPDPQRFSVNHLLAIHHAGNSFDTLLMAGNSSASLIHSAPSPPPPPIRQCRLSCNF